MAVAFIPDIPSEDWELNILLDEIANEITDEELKRLKSYCIGEKGIGKGTLSEIKDAGDFFTHLRYRRMITRDNLVVLQAMLFHLRRRDLQQKVVAYARQFENVVHFYCPSDTPENGYKFLKIHIVGTATFDRDQLEKLRYRIARLLVTPLEFVIVTGIEKTNSILVTFMVPEDYGCCLDKIDANEAASLLFEGIDLIEFDGKVKDLKSMSTIPSEERVFRINHEMESFSKRMEILEKDIDQCEAQLIKTEREKNWYRAEYVKLKKIISSNSYIGYIIQILLLYSMYVKVSKPFEKLSTKAARAYFQTMLQEAKKLNYDSEILRALIEANTTVVKAKVCEDLEIRLLVNDLKLREMASTIQFLQYEKEKLSFYLHVGEKDTVLSQREEFWLQNITNLLWSPIVPIPRRLSGYSISREDIHAILTKLSGEITKKERNKLMQGFSDSEKKSVNKAPNTILEVLFEKQLKETNGQLLLSAWVENVMEMINRPDLIQRFHEMAHATLGLRGNEGQKSKMTSRSPGPRKSPAPKNSRHRRNTVPGTVGRASSESDQSSDFGETEEEKESSLTEFQILNKRMIKIESVLETLVNKSRQEFPFVSFTKGAESDISSYIPKHN